MHTLAFKHFSKQFFYLPIPGNVSGNHDNSSSCLFCLIKALTSLTSINSVLKDKF